VKKILKRIGLFLIIFWLLGVVYRIFIEKPSAGMQYYTYIDAFIDGSLIVGIFILIISAVIRKSAQKFM
jgi:ACR3 family arsenite efflux pump ArsB